MDKAWLGLVEKRLVEYSESGRKYIEGAVVMQRFG